MWVAGQEISHVAAEDIHIWRCTLQAIPDELFIQLKSSLSKDECLRLDRFHFDRDRNKYLLSRGILRNILARYLKIQPKGIQFHYTPFGKPYLPSGELHFNVSHSGDCILYAVSRHADIGIDVEYCKNSIDYLSIATQFFSKNEWVKLSSLAPAQRVIAFYRCWTRKEAFLKAIGTGLQHPLTDVEVSFLAYEKVKLLDVRDSSFNKDLWTLAEIKPAKDYIAAFATQLKNYRLTLLDWE